jgi:glycosyltransferase involved in cell wall biosynthesis
MKFSIVTPVYNGISHIAQCIGSVRQQAHSGACEIEVHHHVQDGGSTDGTREFLSEYLAQKPSSDDYQITCTSEADEGMYDAINKGWLASDGDVLSWINHDEQYLPGTLDKISEIFSSCPDVDVVWGDYVCVDDMGSIVAARREINASRVLMRYCTCYIASCTVFFRRRLLDNGVLRLDESYKLSADRDLYMRLLGKGIKFHHIDAYLSLFSVGDDNLSAKYHQAMMAEDELIDAKYGVRSILWIARAVKACRYGRKLIKGAYKATSVSIGFVLDERMNLHRITGARVGHKYTFKK